jgi:hypothetical protein
VEATLPLEIVMGRTCKRCGQHLDRSRSRGMGRLLRWVTLGLVRQRRCIGCGWRGVVIG